MAALSPSLVDLGNGTEDESGPQSPGAILASPERKKQEQNQGIITLCPHLRIPKHVTFAHEASQTPPLPQEGPGDPPHFTEQD